MSTKAKEYLQGSIIVLILIALIFILNLPKMMLAILIMVIPMNIFFVEVFPRQKKEGRKEAYIIATLFFLVFAMPLYIFDLPKKLYLFISIISLSYIVIYEILNLIPNKKDEK